MGMSVHDEFDSYRSSSVGQFEILIDKLWIIQELVSIFPILLGETFIDLRFYIPQRDYNKLLEDQKWKEATILRLDQVYTFLAKWHL